MRRSFKFSAESPRAYIDEAAELRANGAYREAEAVLRSGHDKYPESPFIMQELGRRLRSIYEDGEALNFFRMAHFQEPTNYQFANEYVDLLLKNHRLKDAEIV